MAYFFYEIFRRFYAFSIPVINNSLSFALQQLEYNEKLSFSEIDQLAFKRAQHIVQHAYNNTEFYRKKYSAVGFEPGDLKTWSDFECLPILEKQEIKENRERMIANTALARNLSPSATGGSTGEPLQIYHDKKLFFWTFALYYRQLRWHNLEIKDKHLGIWRSTDNAKINVKNLNFFSKLRYSNFVLDARRLTKESMDKTLLLIKDLQPTYIYSYVGGASIFADYILENNIDPPSSIRVVFSTSSPLAEGIRQKIEQAFDARVVDQYGSTEILSLACEKNEKGKLYTFNDLRKVETVNKNNQQTDNNVYGDVLLTNYVNEVFPFIRYRNGDRASFFDREPKQGFSTMNPVKGRISENFELINGIIVDGSYLTTVFDTIPHLVKKFEIVQKSKSEILFVLETKNDADFSKACEKVKMDMQFLTKGGINIVFKKDIIKNNDNGKLRYIRKLKNL